MENQSWYPISYQSIAEDVEVSAYNVKRYIEILESLFIIFRVTPHSPTILQEVYLKEPKIYFFDNGLVTANEGAKLENLVANCLLKDIYAKNDYLAEDNSLHYLRTKEGKEIDFAISQGKKVQAIIEVKNSDTDISKTLRYFHIKYNLPSIQLVNVLRNEFVQDEINVLNLAKYLADLLFMIKYFLLHFIGVSTLKKRLLCV